MVKKILMMVLVSLFVLFSFLNNIYTTADPCDDVYIVQPPNNEGGTFYLRLESDPKTKRFPRAGYIQTMTLIKVVRNDDGYLKGKWLSEKKHGTKYLYVEFIGSDGSYGYIKRTSIAPLISMFKYKSQALDCNSNYKLVIPTSPSEDVILFNRPEDNSATPKNIGKFSRSYPDIVFTDEKLEYWDNEDHTKKIPYYKVRFSQKKKEDGSFQERDALIEAEGEGKIYRLFPINPGGYRSIRIVANQSFLSRVKNFVNGILTNYDENKLARAFSKSCDQEYSIEAEIELGATVPFNIVEAGVGVGAKSAIKYPKGYRYCIDCYEGFVSNTKSDVLKTVRCEENSTIDWYTERLTIKDIGENKDIFEIFQHQLETRLKAYFEKPDTTGFSGIKREKMVALKKFEKGSGKDYFTAFSELSKYLDEKFFNIIDLSTVEKSQFKSLPMRLIVDCGK